ncbi:MAG: chemotaxis protein CheW [Rhodocyclaceae bacterium]|nr:chemotaxis protein CheW [Rhodocyclaceae bacterium]
MGEIIRAPANLPAAGAEGPQQYLTFQLGGEMFAVGILNVKEIIEYGAVTEIPMVPRFIRGVINLRGSVVPVIDLSARFGGGATQVGRRTCIVIVELPENEDQQVIGVVVDAVSEVLEIPGSDIEAAPKFGARIRADFIHGMGKVKDRLSGGQSERFVIILNVARVLASEEISLLSRIAQDGNPVGPAAEAA